MKKNSVSYPLWGKRRRKILLIMKFKLFLILACSISVSASVHSQDRLSLSMKDVSLEEVIWEIQSKTEFVFMYLTREITHIKNLNVNVNDQDVQEILKQCLEKTDLSFEISGNAVIIKKKSQLQDNERVKLTGLVSNVKGEPLPGAVVLLKGTSIGVAANAQGKYEISFIKADRVVLIISFAGMKSKEFVWQGEKEYNVVLEESVSELDEVIVTGYESIKRINMTGSVSTVKGEDLHFTGTETLEQMLQGKLPGVMIRNTSGEVGTRQKVRVRGTSSLLGSQEPVWVVDGIIQEDPIPFKTEEVVAFGNDPSNEDMMRNYIGSAISWLNPNMIETITVLKDAAATALYGVRAANGVIVITTKKGQIGRLSIGYSGNVSTSSIFNYKKMHMMNSKERVDVSREVYEKGIVSATSLDPVGYQGLLLDYLQEKISYDGFNAGVKKLETVNTDWFDLLLQRPVSQDHSINISGGSEQTTYTASLSYNKNSGVDKVNSSERFSGRVRLSTIFRENLTLDVSLSASRNNTSAPYTGLRGYDYASTTNRAISAFDEDGDYFFYNKLGYRYNFLYERSQSGNKNTMSTWGLNMLLRYQLLYGLTIESQFGLNISNTFAESYASEFTHLMTTIRGYEFGEYGPNDLKYRQSPLPHGGVLNLEETRNRSYTWRNSISFARHFNDQLHLVTAAIGQEVRSNKYRGFSELTYGYIPGRGKTIVNPPLQVSNALGVYGANSLYGRMSKEITDRSANNLSFYASLTYAYDERYAVNFNVKMEGSNRFGQDKSARFQPVWGGGLRWNVGREHWMSGQNIVNELSLRASFGYQGHAVESVGPDLIASIPSGSSSIAVTGEYQLKISSLPNPKLKWEKTRTINLGADWLFLNSRVNGTFEYYYKKTTDVVSSQGVPLENGLSYMPMNGGVVTNSGMELSFSFVPVRMKNFIWNLSFNTSKNFNKIKSTLSQNESWEMARSGKLNKEGYAVSGFWAFEFAGLDETNGKPTYNLEGMETDAGQTDATVYMKYMGKKDPDLGVGVSMNFRYKTLTLSTSFNASFGGKEFLGDLFPADMVNTTPREYNNLRKELNDRWRQPGDQTNIPSLPYFQTGSIILPSGSMYAYSMYNYTDIRVVKSSYLRCNNISLSYNLPKEHTPDYFQNISISASMSNPFIIVSKDFKGIDPEVARGRQPITRQYSMNLNINF